MAARPLCSYLSNLSKCEVILNLTYAKLRTFSFAVNEKLTLTQDALDHTFSSRSPERYTVFSTVTAMRVYRMYLINLNEYT